jgi:peroxiredoxin Q/BCP
MLKAGDPVPAFSLANDAGETVTHSDLKGRRAVIYFYPKDNTPGCTVEAVDFTARAGDFAKANVVVWGVSRDSVASHCRFRDKHKLKVSLLSDPDLAMHHAFGVWGEKMMYGKKIEGTIRSTFVVETDGTVAHVWSPVRVPGHVDAVLAAVTSTSAPAAAKKTPAEKKRA